MCGSSLVSYPEIEFRFWTSGGTVPQKAFSEIVCRLGDSAGQSSPTPVAIESVKKGTYE